MSRKRRAVSNRMRNGVGIALLLAVALSFLSTCAEESARDVSVFCAASAARVVEELAARYERETGVAVRVSAGASSTLARQIERGAPADVFVSADPAWMAHLVARGRADADAPRDLVANRLVVVRPRGVAVADGAAAFPPGLVALGDPAHVPVGVAARAALEAAGRWEDVRDRVLAAPDARATLRLVELGEAASGVVYASDAAASDRVVVVRSLSDRVLPYRITVLRDATPDAPAFVAYLLAPDAMDAFVQAGFERGPR